MPFVPEQASEQLKNSLALAWAIPGANHHGISRTIRGQMFTEQGSLHQWSQVIWILSQLITYKYLCQPTVKSHDALVLPEVSLMNLIIGIYSQIKWKVEALHNVFILAFLSILQKLSIVWTNLFVRGFVSMREV